MKKQNLTEEIYRMRKLMNFDSKEFNENTTSLDRLIEENILNEQNNQHCKGNNQIDSVIVKVVKNEKIRNRYSFRITAFFPSTGSSDKVYSETIKNLKDQLLNLLDERTKERVNKGIFSIDIISIRSIWGSASNYLNGPLVPTNWNNRSTISSGYETSVPNIKDKLKDKESSDWKKNLEYAKNRGGNFLKWINSSGSKEGITLSPKAEIPESKSMILDTGGCVDEKRDITKYKNPGQSLLVTGNISVVPTTKTFTIPEIEECLNNASITIGYVPDGTHSCDFAIFNVFANDVLIGVANLNNGKLDSAGKITDYTKNRKSDGEVGGMRSSEFVLTDKQIKEIASKSDKGKVSLSIEGFPTEWYLKKEVYVETGFKEPTTHADTPTVVLKLDGKVKYNRKPQVKLKRGSVKTPIYSFNPCLLD
jgi:hypothetical protein